MDVKAAESMLGSSTTTTRLRPYVIVFLLVALPLGVFWRVCNYDFVWDDSLNITENPHLDQVTPSKVLYFWRQPYVGLYIPLTYTVWATVAGFAEYPAADGSGTTFDPRPFHTVNMVLHVLSTLVVFAILRMLVSSEWGACAGALLFALHPVQVEPVAWVTGMKDVLSGFLALVAVWQYLAYAKSQALDSGHKAWRYWLGFVAYGLALLSKPAAVVVPVVALVLDCWVVRRPLRQSAVALIPWFFLAVPVVVATKWVQPDAEVGFIPPLWLRFLIAADALGFYLSKLALPLRLGLDYGRLPARVLQDGGVYITWVIPCGLAVLIWLWRDRRPFLAAAAAVFVIGILPVSGLVPFAFQFISTVADRYLYLSLLGPALALAWLLSQRHGVIAVTACMLLLSLLGITSAFQVQHWRNETTLFTHVLNINSRSWIAYNNLGKAKRAQGELEEAIRHYRQALLANPAFSQGYNNLGNALVAKGELQNAVASYRKALEIAPDNANVHNNLAVALLRQGKIDEAIGHYRQALKIDSAYAEASLNLGNALAMSGKLDEAIEQFRQALQNDPTFVPAHLSLGNTLAASGKLDQAVEHYRQALKIDPNHPNAHYSLGLALAGLGQMEEAIKELRRVLELENSAGVRSQTYFSLGTIFAKQGRLDEAGNYFEEALKLNPGFARARHYMGRVLEARGDLNKAIDYYRQAVRSDPELAEAHQSLGQALAKQGRRDEAIEHYQIALQLLKSRRNGAEGR